MPTVGRKAPNKTHTQSVLFSKDKFSKAQAKKWLKDNGLKADGLDEKDKTYRFRQFDPQDKFRYRNKTISPGVIFVVGYVKKSMTETVEKQSDQVDSMPVPKVIENYDLFDLEAEELLAIWQNLEEILPNRDERFASILVSASIDRGSITFDAKRMPEKTLKVLRDELTKQVTTGIYLSPPFGKQIADGKQAAILKGREYYLLTRFHLLISKETAYGFIRFYSGELLTLPQVADRSSEHLVTKEQIAKWWPNKDALWFYAVRDFIPFESPIQVEPVEGAQVFVENVKLTKEAEEKVKGDVRRVRITSKILKHWIDPETEERLVTGEALVPEETDLQGDIISAEEVKKSAHHFLRECMTMGVQHTATCPDLYPVESYIAPCDLDFDGRVVKAGSWIVTTLIKADHIWEKVKSGEITGYSIEALARGIPLGAEV